MANSPEQEKAEALADASEEAERKQLDETVPGGRFKVGGRIVNAHGEEVSGTVAGATDEGGSTAAGGDGELPEDFPHRELLADYNSKDALNAASDDELLALEGIGEARLKEIRAAAKKL